MGCAICKKAFGNYCFNRIIEGEMHQICYGCVVKIMEQQDKRIAALEAERDKLAFYLRGRTQERDDYRRWLSEAKRDTRPTELEWKEGETDGIYANAAHGSWFEIDHENDVSLISDDFPWSLELEGFTNIESAKKYAEQTARALGLLREETGDES